jgi:hypothetical protein
MRFDPDEVSGLLPEWQSESQITLAPADALLWARVVAWLRPGHYDRRLCGGATVLAETPLAFHAERLTSVRERESVARSLRRCIDDAHSGSAFRSVRPEIDSVHIVAAEDIIDDITLRLHSQRPVTARGMAELRLLLADGGGPLYRYGRGDLGGRLAAAFGWL